MTTDLYAKCPCGSGKKIKFCCKDIIADIERIERMLQGEQRTAALDKINKLLEKHPDRPALLSLKALVYLELQQPENAAPVMERLLEIEPENASAHAMKAMLLAAVGDFPNGLKQLHLALRFSDGVLSQIVYRSYLSICFNLIQSGQYISAYAHLLTLVSITQGQERSSVNMLVNVTSSERLPAIFQGLLIGDEAPENVTWKREFDVAIDRYRHGDWSEAASMMDNMSARILDEPVLLRNQAILQAWTCQNEEAIKSFRYYAAVRGIDMQDAAEAEACAQVLEETVPADVDELVAMTHDIDDANAMMEQLLSADFVEAVPVRANRDSDAPPPKAQFVCFDRPLPSEDETVAVDPQLDDFPQELCSVTLFGKETDRSARLTVVVFKDQKLAETLATVSELTGQNMSIDDPADVIGQAHKVERLFRPNFRAPPSVSLTQFNELQQQWAVSQLADVWANIPLSQFDGKTAKEAASEKKLHCKVLAAILNLEIWADRQPFDFDFDKLRAELGLPLNPKIDPNETDVRSLSPMKLRCVELRKLSDEDLKFVFEVVSVRPNGSFLYRIGGEVLQRASMQDHVDLIEVHERMADLAPSSEEQLEHLGLARDLSVGKGESPASWLVTELDLRIQRGEADIAKRLVSEIQTRYLKEPGIGQMLTQVLGKYGIMPASPGSAASTVSPEAVDALPAEVGSAVSSGAGVWSPENSDASPPPSAGEGGSEKSKLWVPGMD